MGERGEKPNYCWTLQMETHARLLVLSIKLAVFDVGSITFGLLQVIYSRP